MPKLTPEITKNLENLRSTNNGPEEQKITDIVNSLSTEDKRVVALMKDKEGCPLLHQVLRQYRLPLFKELLESFNTPELIQQAIQATNDKTGNTLLEQALSTNPLVASSIFESLREHNQLENTCPFGKPA